MTENEKALLVDAYRELSGEVKQYKVEEKVTVLFSRYVYAEGPVEAEQKVWALDPLPWDKGVSLDDWQLTVYDAKTGNVLLENEH